MKIPNKTTIVTWAFLLAFSIVAQSQKRGPDPDAILIGPRQQPVVLLVGTFHFAYYNFDAHKVAKDQQVNILSAQKQQEMEELVKYLKKFRPTKIAIEGGANTSYIMNRYRTYKRGKKPLDRNEIDQIGFRLMETCNLDTIYGVDARSLEHDLYNGKDSTAFRFTLDSIFADYDFIGEDSISKRIEQYAKADDQLALTMSLLDYFKYTNSDKILNREFGFYLNGDFTLGDTRGADALAIGWYSRNLRIYRHIQQITTDPSDRILVIFGRGHMEILKHLFECSPQYKLIKFNELK
ncbi:MAG TPA: DUF5694 domain-containing protein [Niastella sp.]